MRRLVLLIGWLGCSGGSETPAVPVEPVSKAAPTLPDSRPKTGKVIPPQVAPEPLQNSALNALPPPSSWAVEAGRSLVVEAQTVRLDGVELAREGAAFGRGTDSRLTRLLSPCALVFWEGGRWVEAERQAPPCAESGQRYLRLEHTTWGMPGGGRYSYLADGQAWRRREGGYFNVTAGAWSGADGEVMTFGSSQFDVARLDGCHRAFVHRASGQLSRAHRTFPSCVSAERDYDGVDWTVWALANGDVLDVRGDGAGLLEPASGGSGVAVRVERTATGLVLHLASALGGQPELRRFDLQGCSGTERGTGLGLSRNYPPCPEP